MKFVRRSRLLIPLLAAALTTGCWNSSGSEVVVYTALDREFSEPILQDFENETGVDVLAKYDVESTKTVGLTNAIIQEKSRPRCEVFWNNEILHTLRLQQQEGLSAQFPVTPKVDVAPRVKSGQPVRWMDVDFNAAADKWDEAYEFLKAEFHSAE